VRVHLFALLSFNFALSYSINIPLFYLFLIQLLMVVLMRRRAVPMLVLKFLPSCPLLTIMVNELWLCCCLSVAIFCCFNTQFFLLYLTASIFCYCLSRDVFFQDSKAGTPVVPGENSSSQDLNASAKFGGDPPASVEGKSREDSSAPAESAAAKPHASSILRDVSPQDSKADNPGDNSRAQELNASAKLGSDLPALVDGNILTSREEISGPAEDSGNELHGCKWRVSYLFLPLLSTYLLSSAYLCHPTYFFLFTSAYLLTYLPLPIYFGLPPHLPTYLSHYLSLPNYSNCCCFGC
jgi:hypothetical protein